MPLNVSRMCATVRLPLASATSDRDTRLLRVELHKARRLSSKWRAHATWPFCDRTYINIYAAGPGLRFCKVSHDIIVVNDVSSHRPSVLCHTCSQLGSRFWRRPARRVYSLQPAGRQRCQVSPAGNQAVIEQHAGSTTSPVRLQSALASACVVTMQCCCQQAGICC